MLEVNTNLSLEAKCVHGTPHSPSLLEGFQTNFHSLVQKPSIPMSVNGILHSKIPIQTYNLSTNFMQQNPSSEAHSHSTNKVLKFLTFYGTWKIITIVGAFPLVTTSRS
jgi:hypothetical protein